MADAGDELLDGDLDETAFDDLDGEQEDALLADDDFESYENSHVIYSETSDSVHNSHTDVYQVIDQVQDGEEILEDGVEDDVLDIAVGDELDEPELESSHGTEQGWTDNTSRTIEDSSKEGTDLAGVSSSTQGLPVARRGTGVGGESDDEDTEGRGSRFRSERTNVVSLKSVTGSKNLNDIPDSLDKVRTPQHSGGMLQNRGRGPRGGMRGRLGPHPMRGGMMVRGALRRGPHMMPPPQMPPPGHKIHVNPHFRGGMQHGPAVWDNDRLPPPPGCENFGNNPHNKDMGWGGPMPPQHMGRPGMPPHHHPGPHGPFPGPQGYHPHHPQGYEDPYRPMDPAQQNSPNRIVQFNENSPRVTVENQHYQHQGYDQNYGPPNNQFQPPPPHFNNNNTYPPNQFNHPQRPNFPPQNPYPGPNPSNYSGYSQPDFQHQNQPYQNYNNNWNSQQPVGDFYPPNQPQPQPPSFNHPQPQFRPPQPPFPNQPQNFRPPPQKMFQNNPRGSVMKRLASKPVVSPITPPKQMRFDHKPTVNTRSNLQEIKTIDSLPDTTTKPDPEPEIEEDEETKQYRLKIAEQKALREKILKEKEARRLAAALEKQKQTHGESNTNLATVAVSVPKPIQVQQRPVNMQQKPVQMQQQQQTVQRVQMQQQALRNLGRGRGQSVNMVVPIQKATAKGRVMPKQMGKANQKNTNNVAKLPTMPQVQIQNIQGTVYKIVKVRTKEGSIVTRKVSSVLYCIHSMFTHSLPLSLPFLQRNKTPIAITQGGVTTSLTKTVNNPATGVATNSNRKVVLNVNNQVKIGTTSILRGTTSTRMVPTKNAQGRTLFTVQTTPLANMPKITPQRLVIDNRPSNASAVKVAAVPNLPDSSLVTIDNLSLSTTQANIQKMAKQVGTLTSFSYEPDQKKATLRFQKIQEAKEFHKKFNRKMVDLSRILVTVVPE